MNQFGAAMEFADGIPYYRAAIDYPCLVSGEDEVGYVVLARVERLISTFEENSYDIEDSPVHELLGFQESLQEDRLNGLFTGLSYPSGYDGSHVDTDEPFCIVTVADKRSEDDEIPQYFAADIDCYTDVCEDWWGIPYEFPAMRWHISCCMVSSGRSIRLHISMSIYESESSAPILPEAPYYFAEGVLAGLLEPIGSTVPQVAGTMLVPEALSLDFSTLEGMQTRGTDSPVDVIIEGSPVEAVDGIPVTLKDSYLSEFYSDGLGVSYSPIDVVQNLSFTRWYLFQQMMRDPHREVPIVLICSDKNGEYPIDPEAFANRVAGMANVFYADLTDNDVKSLLNAIFRRRGAEYKFRCRKGFIRLYPGGVNIGNEDDARYCAQYRGAESMDIDPDGYDEYYSLVSQLITLQPYASAEFRDVRSLVYALDKMTYKHRLQALKNLETIDPKRAATARAELSGEEELISALEEAWDRNDELEKELASVVKERDEERTERGLGEAAIAQERGTNRYLSERCSSLERKNRELEGRETLAKELKDSLPKTVEEVLSVVLEAFKSRVAATDSVLEEAKSISNEHLDDAWVILTHMPTTVWSAFFEECSDVTGTIEEAVGREFAPTETGKTKSMPGFKKTRTVKYKGQNVDIRAHIKGHSNEFRVYFGKYEADGERLIVIGSLTHLPVSSHKH